MERITKARLASILMVIAGVWAMLSPLFIAITGAALVSLLITGGVMIVAAIVQLLWESSVPSWITGLAAIWLLLSAVVFTVSNAVIWNEVITGAITLILSMWDGVEIGEVRHLHHGTTA